MKRLVSRLAFAGLVNVLVLTWLLPAVRGAESDRGEPVSNQRARELIDELGNKGVRAVYPEQGDPYLVIPKTFNWDAHQEVRRTINEIIKMGVAAFPDLAAHANDDRFSCFVVGAVDVPRKVGAICEAILGCQIDVYPYDIRSKQEMMWHVNAIHRLHSENKSAGWAEWWKKNRDKSLLEMQIAVAESCMLTFKSEKRQESQDMDTMDTEEYHQFDIWRASQLKGLEQMVQELKKEKRPKPGNLWLDIRTIDRSRVTKIGDEERYRFYNGK